MSRLSTINKDGIDILSDLGWRITQSTDDHRKSAFLFKWLSVLIPRYDAVIVLGTSPPHNPEEKISRSNIFSID